jgi:pilus assembly protein TadC
MVVFMFGRLCILLSRRVPRDTRESTQQMLDFGGEDIAPELWMADTILLSTIIAIIVTLLFFALGTSVFQKDLSFILGRYLALTLLLVLIIAFALVALVRYLLVSFKIDDRKAKCQDILPDFLSVVAMNLSAGMEPLTALYVSLRPDFNPITDEMKKSRSLSLGSKSLIDQLALLKTRIDSSSLRTTISIIERASSAGGDLATLLDSVSKDLRESNKVQKELESATKGYVTFIAFLAIVGVPILLSVATLFLSVVTVPNVAGGLTSMLAINLSGKPIPVGQIETLFIVMLTFSSISASFIFSVLWRGEMKHGAKYIPIMVPASLFVFFLAKGVLKGLLGSFIGFGTSL